MLPQTPRVSPRQQISLAALQTAANTTSKQLLNHACVLHDSRIKQKEIGAVGRASQDSSIILEMIS